MLSEIVGPWITLLLLVIPLIYAERFIHQHMFGVGYLLTKDKESATAVYYLVFFPGVFLHEFIQYLAAGALNVKIKKLTTRPQKQDNGTLRYDFVTIEKTDTLRAAIIGGLPFVVGAIVIWTISTSILDLTRIPTAFATGDLPTIGRALTDTLNTPDFWLWLYILFAISNGMLPTKEDRQGWKFILFAMVGISVFFTVLGLDAVIINTLRGPVADGLGLVNTALFIILSIDLGAILVLGLVEDTLERVRGEKMDYSGPEDATRKLSRERKPGSNLPLPRGEPLPSIYNLTLPVPEDVPDKGTLPEPAKPKPKPEPTPATTRPRPEPRPQPMQEPVAETEEQPAPRPAAARASAEDVEGTLDPDAVARAQRDPRLPRSSSSPFRRSPLAEDEQEEQPEEAAPPAAETPTHSPAVKAPPPPTSSERSRRPAASTPERRSGPGRRETPEPTSRFARRQPSSSPEEKESSSQTPRGRRVSPAVEPPPPPARDRETANRETASSPSAGRPPQRRPGPAAEQQDEATPARPARPTGRFRSASQSETTGSRRPWRRPVPKPSEQQEGEQADTPASDDVEYVDFDDV